MKRVQFEHETGTSVVCEVQEEEHEDYFLLTFNGGVTAFELEALAQALQSPALTAQEHARGVTEAARWRRVGPEVPPLRGVLDLSLDDAAHVKCPACHVAPGVACRSKDGSTHAARESRFAKFRTSGKVREKGW